MIKSLIKELAHDQITLSQALTRSKLIQSKLKVDAFKSWLANEMSGYSNDKEVPSYRILDTKILGNFADDFGRQWTNVPLMLQELGASIGMNLYSYTETGSINSIET